MKEENKKHSKWCLISQDFQKHSGVLKEGEFICACGVAKHVCNFQREIKVENYTRESKFCMNCGECIEI